MNKKYEILITNDDGYEAEGLKKLIEAISTIENANITVVAPANEKSACGHSLTLNHPLRFKKVDDNFYKLEDGTPSDCVYLSLSAIYADEKKPDLVISGINKGSNMGEDITYSGTCSAAMEAVLHDIPAFAISQVVDFTHPFIDFSLAAKTAKEIALKILTDSFPLPHREFLNINIPFNKKTASTKITYAGYRYYFDEATLHRNPRGEEYYWLGLHPLAFKPREGKEEFMCDYDAVEAGYISITPVMLDMSAYKSIKRLENWIDTKE
jgi:5'-nucleotidase